MFGDCVMVFVFFCGIFMVIYMVDVERFWEKKLRKNINKFLLDFIVILIYIKNLVYFFF